MASKARESFLIGVEALRQSIDTELVSGSDTVGAFLRRGLTIVSYNLLEAFMTERLEEVTAYVNAGLGHFSDLPDGIKKAATQELIRVAHSRLQWANDDLSSIIDYATSLGECLAASSGPLRLSPLMWQWSGSNMSAHDFHRTLRLFHVKDPWDTIKDLVARIGAALPDPRQALVGLAQERNKCAHQSSYSVSNLLIRSVPNQVLLLALGADISISISAHKLHQADANYYSDEKWLHPGRLSFRFVGERKNNWAEVVEGQTKATRLSVNRDAAVKAALNSAKGKSQIVVVQDATRQTLDWAYPEFP